MSESEALMQAVRALPEHSLTTSMRSPRGTFERSFKGALLFDYVVAAHLIERPDTIGALGNYYIVVEGEDGFRIAVAFAEVNPRFVTKQVLLAYAQDGEPIRTGVRLVVPGDGTAGRSILGVAKIEVHRVDFEAPANQVAGSIVVHGEIEGQQTWSAAELAAVTQHEVDNQPTQRRGATFPSQHYSGVRLHELLSQAGIRVDPDIHEDFLRKIVVLRGSDGYTAVVAGGEIEPRFLNGDVLVALPDAAGATAAYRLVVPYDKAIGRSVKDLATIELRYA